MEALIDRRAAASLARHFTSINKHVPLQPIRTMAEYDAAGAAFGGLLDAGAGDEAHALANRVATLGELIADFDARHYPAKPVGAIEILRHLMEAHALSQGDLPEVGSQGVVSEVLRGHRELNLRQIRALAKRFGVPASLFVDG